MRFKAAFQDLTLFVEFFKLFTNEFIQFSPNGNKERKAARYLVLWVKF